MTSKAVPAGLVPAVINVAPGTFLAIVAACAVAGTVAAIVSGSSVVVPVVVVELLLGVLIGPHVLGLHVNELILFFSDLGLGLLFFFAGYEIDLRRISGEPLRLALAGWMFSLCSEGSPRASSPVRCSRRVRCRRSTPSSMLSRSACSFPSSSS